MNFFFVHHPAKNAEDKPGEHTLVPLQNHAHYTNEGSEFLDDAIRIKDLPLMYTEENIAAGSPKDLW